MRIATDCTALGGGRAEHRVEQPGELLVELGAAEVEKLAGAFVALGDDACVQQSLEVVASCRLRDGDRQRTAAELRAVAPGELADDLEPDRVGERLDDLKAVGLGLSG